MGNIPNSPPKSSFEFERARHQLRNDMGGFAKYLLNLKPKQLPKLLKENLTEEMLSAVVRAVSEHIVDSKPKAALAIFKNMALVNRFSTTLLFLNDEETRLLR